MRSQELRRLLIQVRNSRWTLPWWFLGNAADCQVKLWFSSFNVNLPRGTSDLLNVSFHDEFSFACWKITYWNGSQHQKHTSHLQPPVWGSGSLRCTSHYCWAQLWKKHLKPTWASAKLGHWLGGLLPGPLVSVCKIGMLICCEPSSKWGHVYYLEHGRNPSNL